MKTIADLIARVKELENATPGPENVPAVAEALLELEEFMRQEDERIKERDLNEFEIAKKHGVL